MRDAGKEEAAILVESKQANADYQAALHAIELQRVTDLAQFNLSKRESDDINAQSLLRQLAALETLNQAEDAAAQKRKALRDKEAQEVAKAADAVGTAAQSVGGTTGKGLQAATSAISKLSAGWKDSKTHAADAISASGSVAAAFTSDAKQQAGIMAIFETAAGFAAYPDPVGMATHFASAALYAAVAGGVVPSASGGSPGVSGDSGGKSGTSGGGFGGGGSGSGSGTTNIYLGTGVTEQQAAVMVAKNNSTVGKTGMTKLASKGV